MRLLNAAGMDSPWKFDAASLVIDEGETALVDMRQVNGVRTALSTDTDRVRASAFWFEPNLSGGTGNNGVAIIDVSTCIDLSGVPDPCISWDNQPQRQRYRHEDAGGLTWYFKVIGTDVSVSSRADYYPNYARRKVLLTWFFEDSDRDDADGPDATVD